MNDDYKPLDMSEKIAILHLLINLHFQSESVNMGYVIPAGSKECVI